MTRACFFLQRATPSRRSLSFVRPLGVVLFLTGCAGTTVAAPKRAGPDADARASQVSARVLELLVETNGVPGMGAAVWRDGKVVWSGSAGYRDLETRTPVDDQTVFRLASVSKVITATAAAKLKEEGLLDPDAPVSTLVPYLPADRWPAITARQLAAHTSGMPHYEDADENLGGHRYATVREAVGIFQDRPLLSPPGEKYGYSSWGYTLLSAEIEAAAGKPFLDYLATEITPGLRIGPDATDGPDPRVSRAYDIEDGPIHREPPHDISYTWAGGGLSATAPDLATFGGRVVTGKIVTPATFAWMTTPMTLNSGEPVTEGEYKVGFGWRLARDFDGESIVHHAGITVGARSVLVLYPDRKLSVSLLSNALWTSAIEPTAITLTAPFRPGAAAGLPKRACPTGAVRFEGIFEGKPIVGTARFAKRQGLCEGEMSTDNAFGAWLNGFPQKDVANLRLVGLDPEGGFARAALVTPIGVFDLRGEGADGYAARLGGKKGNLTLAFKAPGT